MNSAAQMHHRAVQTNHRGQSGALVISLDFELHWGVRDCVPLDKAERKRLLIARAMVPKILALFSEYSIRATWATVGALFADSGEQFNAFAPRTRPAYAASTLNPYIEKLGRSEQDDPFHFAPSLIREIASTSGQEIASHSFSHYYCMEKGQDGEAFEADLVSAVSIARHCGYRLESFVFPRNQANRAYFSVAARHGIRVIRAVGEAGPYAAMDFNGQKRWKHRGARLLDTFTNVYGAQTVPWPVHESPAILKPSRYLQPCRSWLRPLDSLKIDRIVSQMKAAAEEGTVFHLWWHPEDFATGGDANLSVLRQVLCAFCELRDRKRMRSLNMADTIRVKARSKQN